MCRTRQHQAELRGNDVGDSLLGIIHIKQANAVARGLDAVQVVRELGKHIGGGGGGKPTLAEAGGKNPDGIADALAAAKGLVAP